MDDHSDNTPTASEPTAAPFSYLEDDFLLSPRTAYCIAAALQLELDAGPGAIECGVKHEDFSFFNWLPPIALRLHGNDPEWLGKLLQEGSLLTSRLRTGPLQDGEFTENTAQRVFLAHAINAAELLVADREIGAEEDFKESGLVLPITDHEYDWPNAKACLFEDLDHEWLYAPSLDGIESGDDAIGKQLGIGRELHPDHWFELSR